MQLDIPTAFDLKSFCQMVYPLLGTDAGAWYFKGWCNLLRASGRDHRGLPQRFPIPGLFDFWIYYTDEVTERLEELVSAAKRLMQEISVIDYQKAARGLPGFCRFGSWNTGLWVWEKPRGQREKRLFGLPDSYRFQAGTGCEVMGLTGRTGKRNRWQMGLFVIC